MTTGLKIRDAVQADLPEVVALTCNAMEPDLLNAFLWSPRRAEAVQKETASLMASLGKRFIHPTNRCHIHVVNDSLTNEIIGWTLIRWEDGSWPLTPSAEGTHFAAVYQRAVKEKWVPLVANKAHVVLGALHVRPDRQGQGIGRFMVDWLYEHYDLSKETVIVQTRAMSEGFYHKLGWKTVDVTELDLSQWGGVGQGYGIHCSPQMIRAP